MKRSVLKIGEELGLSTEETTALRRRCRLWLYNRHGQSGHEIAKLQEIDFRNEARCFLSRYGKELFASSIRSRKVTGIMDDRLLMRMAAVISCQVEYVRRQMRVAQQENQPTIHERDTPHSAHESTSSMEDCEDREYEPSNIATDSPLRKRHNTRLNAQPGMPICESIELDLPLGARSTTLSRTRWKDTNMQNLCLTKEAEGRKLSGGQRTPKGQEHAASIRQRQPVADTIELPTLPRSSVEASCHDRRTESRSRQLFATPPIASSGIMLETAPTPMFSSDPAWPEQSANTRQVSSFSNVDFGDLDFDQFFAYPSNQEHSIAGSVEPLSGHRLLPYRYQTPRCQQTPPESVKSTVKNNSGGMEGAQHIDHKPPLGVAPVQVVDLTDSEEVKIWVGCDYYVSIKRDRTVEALQCVMDALSEKSRKCQRAAQRASGSLPQRLAAEQLAIFMCNLMGGLRKDEQIWAGKSGIDTSTGLG